MHLFGVLSQVFNAFVMMQLFNQINMRKVSIPHYLTPPTISAWFASDLACRTQVRPEDRNPFAGLLANRVFVVVTAAELLLQVRRAAHYKIPA